MDDQVLKAKPWANFNRYLSMQIIVHDVVRYTSIVFIFVRVSKANSKVHVY